MNMILFDEVISDPAPFVEELKAVSVPEPLCNQYERPREATYVSRFSRGGGGSESHVFTLFIRVLTVGTLPVGQGASWPVINKSKCCVRKQNQTCIVLRVSSPSLPPSLPPSLVCLIVRHPISCLRMDHCPACYAAMRPRPPPSPLSPPLPHHNYRPTSPRTCPPLFPPSSSLPHHNYRNFVDLPKDLSSSVFHHLQLSWGAK